MLSSISFLCVVLLLLCSYGHIFSSARDTLTHEYPLIDDGSAALVSAGGKFSLGFFTPTSAEQGSSDAETRYVGIWYHGLIPTTVIWIANRDVPIPASSTGVLTIEEGNFSVLDNDTKKAYWSASIGTSRPLNTSMMTVMIMDSGNLVLSENGDELTADPLWQSFQYPTDTFIPGMLMDASLELTSWSDVDDPRTGNYTFLLDGTNVFTLSNNSVPYWKREVPSTSFSTDEMHPEVAYMLLNFSTSSSLYTSRPRFNYTRLVIDSLGVLNGLIWNDTVKQWDIFFTEPKDQCSFINPCGYFTSCNIDNSPLVCKCLPGFIPQFIENWKTGDFSSGCTRQSSCSKNDVFLSIKVKRAGKYDSSPYVTNEIECKNTYLGNCQCQAYSSASAANDTTRRDIRKNVICYIWTTDLNNLVEDSGNSAKILNARVSLSDLESTSRDCQPACGTTTIPYPLSIASYCGDPMYLSFVCNTSTSEFIFHGPDDTSFKVINISQSTQRFIVISKEKNYCDSKNKKPNISYPFKVINRCKSELTRNTNSTLNSSSSASVIEMGWEPSYSKVVDCKDWPN